MAKEYQVLRIDELTRVGDMSRLEKYYRHTIKTAGGVTLSVDIDERDFTPVKAPPILAKHAADTDKILTSGG